MLETRQSGSSLSGKYLLGMGPDHNNIQRAATWQAFSVLRPGKCLAGAPNAGYTMCSQISPQHLTLKITANIQPSIRRAPQSLARPALSKQLPLLLCFSRARL